MELKELELSEAELGAELVVSLLHDEGFEPREMIPALVKAIHNICEEYSATERIYHEAESLLQQWPD